MGITVIAQGLSFPCPWRGVGVVHQALTKGKGPKEPSGGLWIPGNSYGLGPTWVWP